MARRLFLLLLASSLLVPAAVQARPGTPYPRTAQGKGVIKEGGAKTRLKILAVDNGATDAGRADLRIGTEDLAFDINCVNVVSPELAIAAGSPDGVRSFLFVIKDGLTDSPDELHVSENQAAQAICAIGIAPGAESMSLSRGDFRISTTS